jgi:hypothetical protein
MDQLIDSAIWVVLKMSPELGVTITKLIANTSRKILFLRELVDPMFVDDNIRRDFHDVFFANSGPPRQTDQRLFTPNGCSLLPMRRFTLKWRYPTKPCRWLSQCLYRGSNTMGQRSGRLTWH